MANAVSRNRLREFLPAAWGNDFDSLVDQFFGAGGRGVQAFYVPASVWEEEARTMSSSTCPASPASTSN